MVVEEGNIHIHTGRSEKNNGRQRNNVTTTEVYFCLFKNLLNVTMSNFNVFRANIIKYL